jgi:hypothetical protein
MSKIVLALALTRSATVAEAVRAYEATMLPRSTETAKLLEGGAEHLLSDELPDFMQDEGAQP